MIRRVLVVGDTAVPFMPTVGPELAFAGSKTIGGADMGYDDPFDYFRDLDKQMRQMNQPARAWPKKRGQWWNKRKVERR